MYNTWAPYLYLSVFLVLIFIAEFCYHVFKLRTEYTRKIIHFGAGVLVLFFPYYVQQPLLALAFCSSFLLLIFLSEQYHFFPSIHNIGRSSYGAYLLPLVFFFNYLIYYYSQEYIYYYLPILVLAISDALAAIIGQLWPILPYSILKNNKTLSGSFAFFLSAFILSSVCLWFFEHISFSHAIIISFSVALTSSLIEALSSKGYDNINIPFVVLLNIYIFKEVIVLI